MTPSEWALWGILCPPAEPRNSRAASQTCETGALSPVTAVTGCFWPPRVPCQSCEWPAWVIYTTPRESPCHVAGKWRINAANHVGRRGNSRNCQAGVKYGERWCLSGSTQSNSTTGFGSSALQVYTVWCKTLWVAAALRWHCIYCRAEECELYPCGVLKPDYRHGNI